MLEINLRTWVDDTGQTLYGVHLASAECYVFGCAIHNPTEHDLNHLPLHFANAFRMFVRVDEDGTWHADPDELAWRQRNPEIAWEHFRYRWEDVL